MERKFLKRKFRSGLKALTRVLEPSPRITSEDVKQEMSEKGYLFRPYLRTGAMKAQPKKSYISLDISTQSLLSLDDYLLLMERITGEVEDYQSIPEGLTLDILNVIFLLSGLSDSEKDQIIFSLGQVGEQAEELFYTDEEESDDDEQQ